MLVRGQNLETSFITEQTLPESDKSFKRSLLSTVYSKLII